MMVYDNEDERMVIGCVSEVKVFADAFETAVKEYDSFAEVYRTEGMSATDEMPEHVTLLYSSPSGYVFFGEVRKDNDLGPTFARATKVMYNADDFTRDEVALIARDVKEYWGWTDEAKDTLILKLSEKRPLSDDETKVLVGAIFDNSLDVGREGHVSPNFLPNVVKEMVGMAMSGNNKEGFNLSMEFHSPEWYGKDVKKA